MPIFTYLPFRGMCVCMYVLCSEYWCPPNVHMKRCWYLGVIEISALMKRAPEHCLVLGVMI